MFKKQILEIIISFILFLFLGGCSFKVKEDTGEVQVEKYEEVLQVNESKATIEIRQVKEKIYYMVEESVRKQEEYAQ